MLSCLKKKKIAKGLDRMVLTGSCGPTPVLAIHGINKKFQFFRLKKPVWFWKPCLWPFIYDIHCIYFHIYIYIYIYDDVCCSSPISLCVVSFLSLYTCYLLYASLYFYFTLRCLDEFCLKCFRKTGCQNLSCHELFSCKVFQEFVLWLDFIVFNKWLWV